MATFDELKKLVSLFPLLPGIYQMKRNSGEMLYVGKAKELRKRVQSYFRSQNSGKVEVLMSHVDSIEYIVTNSEYEALLLEHNVIKEHQPKYNILLRDDKTFPLIKITNEEYPRVIKTRKLSSDGGEYFGPYIDLFLINKYLDLIEKSFSLRRCNKMKTRAHPCLYYHLGRCMAVCAGLNTKEEYLARVKKIRSLMKGHTKMLKKQITIQMHRYAQIQKYEQAAMCRNSLAGIEAIEVQQHMIDNQPEMRNYIGIVTHDNKCCIVVVHMKEGRMIEQHTTHLTTFDSLEDTLEQFLLSYYHTQTLYPEIIFIPLKLSQGIHMFFDQHNTSIQLPIQPKDAAIIRFTKENARYGIQQQMQQHGNYESVKLLQKVLNLKDPPMRIEGFDIAHIGGIHTTAAMVSFYNGIPDKTQYRHFTIKSLEEGKIDDYQSIQEAVSRRYTKARNEKKLLPNLILIDGGIGQVNSAQEILNALDLEIPIIGLAKKQEEVFFPGRLEVGIKRSIRSNPLQIPLNNPASHLLQAVRDEAHRFATSFRAKKQKGDLNLSLYTSVKGIGAHTARKIATLFPNPKGIVESQIDFLMSSLRISRNIAEALKLCVVQSLEHK